MDENVRFGKFVRTLREQRTFMDDEGRIRQWSQEYLAERAQISLRQLSKIEQGDVANLRRFLKPLADAFDLTESQRAEFYAVAGYLYMTEKKPDLEVIRDLFERIPYPASARTPLFDLLCFNHYNYLLFDYTPEKIALLHDDFGSNLLRVLFDRAFSHEVLIGGPDKWKSEILKSIQTFRFQSFRYIHTSRYRRIVEEMSRRYPAFLTRWDDLARNETSLSPIAVIHNPTFGTMEFLSLRTSQRFMSNVEISIYVPLASSEEKYQRLREQVKANVVYFFREEPLD